MNIISKKLDQSRGKCCLIPFITAGYPDINTTINAIYELDNQGADIIELGIPYSDALADGTVIQKASLVAIKQKVYIDQVLFILSSVHKNINAPIILFTYYNPVLKRGILRFIDEISSMGAKGLIIPDLPLEDADDLIILCNKKNIELILFIAPTSSLTRIQIITQKSPGCIYLVSSTGVTGARKSISNEMLDLANYIKKISSKLIILGFGISTALQAQKVSQWNIDGIVVGTAFIEKLPLDNKGQNLNNLSLFCKSLKDAIN